LDQYDLTQKKDKAIDVNAVIEEGGFRLGKPLTMEQKLERLFSMQKKVKKPRKGKPNRRKGKSKKGRKG
jgi:hypothetical protein